MIIWQKRELKKNAYAKKAYDDLRIQVNKKAIIKDYAASKGKSTNGLVNELPEAEIHALKNIKRGKAE